MRKITAVICWLLCVGCWQVQGMELIPLNHGWTFHRGFQASASDMLQVSLPHTWNAADAMFGNTDYFRGLCTYIRPLRLPDRCKGRRVFLRVAAAQTVADVFIDHRFVMQHRGGYTAFVAEVTDFLTPGKESELVIRVNNAPTFDIAPVCGDFNIYGGLYQGVELIVTEDVCIRPDYYASSGVFVTQTQVTRQRAELDITTLLSSRHQTLDVCEVEFRLIDMAGKCVCHASSRKIDADGRVRMHATLMAPHLWDGVDDPYLYRAAVVLRQNGVETDRRDVEIGLRYFHADADKGFFLNGRPYRLLGVNRHQDRAERASAFRPEDHDEDLDLIQEMGCNAVRLCHYPQSPYMHQQMDLRGLVAWVEIPFVNVYVNHPAYDENLRQQLCELILQNYNHPSILFWGLFNEINSGWLDRPSQMTKALHELAHQLDSSRLTMGASNQDDDFNGMPDLIAFNKYFGWYGDSMEDMGRWVDREHAAHPNRKMGISEYGAGACIYQQSDTLNHPQPWGQWHPENWQTYYHVENWRQLQERPFLWCNFIWCMFDFSSAGRREGSTMGRNDKGLVSYDRKTKKDAFYFYKANWNNREQILHLVGKRACKRTQSVTRVEAFSSSGPAELIVNGRSYGWQTPDKVHVLQWGQIQLNEGRNQIVVRNSTCQDSCVWELCKHGVRTTIFGEM